MKNKGKSLVVAGLVAVGLLTGCGTGQQESQEAQELKSLRQEVRELRELQTQAMKYEARQAQELSHYRLEVLKSINSAEKLSEVTGQN